MTDFVFKATARKDIGKGASRRLRREGLIPSIVYGSDKEPQEIILNHNEVLKLFRHEAVYSSVLTVDVDGKKEKAILRDVQRHPFKPLITHLDFLRVNANEELTASVPVHLLNEETSVGVKMGGILSQTLTTIEVSCLPKDLPAAIEVDVATLEVGSGITIADLTEIKGVTFLTAGEEQIVAIHHPVTETEETTEEAEAPAEEESKE